MPLCGLPQNLGKAPEIKARVWFNTGRYKSLRLNKLRGKVVVVCFWTFNDRNCWEAIARLNRWYEEYKLEGLEIIGVHAAEWELDESQSNLAKTIDDLGIEFPVASEDDAAVRAAYGQQGWPSISLIDRDGYIRAQYSGVLPFSNMEVMLKGLLEEGRSQAILNRDRVY